MTETVFMQSDRCPVCGATLNAASGIEHEETPRPGDATVCVHCAAILLFDDDLRLRKPTKAERPRLIMDRTLLATIRAVNLVKQMKQQEDEP